MTSGIARPRVILGPRAPSVSGRTQAGVPAILRWPRMADDDLPRSTRPHSELDPRRAGGADDRCRARRAAAVDPAQRLFRGRGVRARAFAAREDRAARRGGRERRRRRQRAARQDRRNAVGLPDRDHDGLDRHRFPRRAGPCRSFSSPPSARSCLTAWPSASPLPSPSRSPRRCTSPSASRSRRCSRSPGPSRRRAACRARSTGSGGSALRSPAFLTKVSNAIVRLFGVDPSSIDEKHTSEDLQADHRRLEQRRLARPRRGGDAVRRLPPPRAEGA